MKFLKYKFSAFFASFLQTELPKAPFPIPDHPGQLLGSTGGRFIRKVLRGPEAIEFATGILYLKKAAPRALESELKAAIEKTKKVLTTSQPLPDIPNSPASFGELLEECRRTVREVFTVDGKFIRFSERDLHKPCAPSIKACFQAKRDELGTFGCLRRDGYLVPAPAQSDMDDGALGLDPEDLLDRSMSSSAKDCTLGHIYRDAVEVDVKERERRSGVDGCESRGEDGDLVPLRVSDRFRNYFQLRYRVLYEQVRRKSVSQQFDVKLIALAESLKIRVISKGPCYKYFLLKPLQVFLSKLLGRHVPFALTRNTDLTFTTELLNSVLGDQEGQFHSLDYEGATDNFNPLVSEVICDEISSCMGLDDQLRSDFRDALTGHYLDGQRQRWGQLMGSVVSFVVLCVGNAAIVRRSLELTHQRSIPLSTCPMLINGDDGLVRAPPCFLSIWKQLSTLVGLKPSLGKVYSHDRYANINSTSFWLGPDGRLSHIPYVNMGLAYGLKRSGELQNRDLYDEYDPQTSSLGSRHRNLLDTCPVRLRRSVHDLFLRCHHDLLRSPLLSGISWYAPESLGGLGLVSLLDDCLEPLREFSVLDRRIVDHLTSYPDSSLHRLPTEAPLAVRSLWTQALPYKRTRACSYDMSENDIGFLDVSTYFLAPGFLETDLGDPLLQLHHNRRVWRRLRRRFLIPSLSPSVPMDLD
jgi:hypothetical protein